MDSMLAAIVEMAGKPAILKTIARPTPKAGEVLVRVKASGLNPLDLKIRAGLAAHAKQPLPAILGIDLTGVVEDLGDGVTEFSVGDEVYGMTGGVGGHQGSLAQYSAVDVRLIAQKPSSITMREAAALPLAAITAWEGLIDLAHVKAGEKLLVIGAGGVGQIVIQIGRAIGADVYAIDRSKGEFITDMGATSLAVETGILEHLEVHTAGHGFDVVYDTVGGEGLDTAFAAVARRGRVVSCLGWGTHALAPLSFKSASYAGVFTLVPLLTGEGRERHGEILREVASIVDDGKLRALVDGRTYGLDTLNDAFSLLESRANTGKVVVSL
ncbi:zinc-dependent alcohol dehydrogenase family protein [Rhizobium cauense]|uniref:zinc-dependent alcohol dehydrogenase family protein n=1 Tax=Rhizobium cauense TaxID=1166683 RepID=UPI001C6E31EA|nr:zinc-dependent alcohol dehydrogenase family protein [Rhizobium cauense]MBW9114702.1 zinc-dependent alcohol dehydrogenase family protein [Rhizobium cauense]